MADYFYDTFSKGGSTYGVINSTPFFPHIIEYNGVVYAQFNKGYLINYGSVSKIGGSTVDLEISKNHFLDVRAVDGGDVSDETAREVGFTDNKLVFTIDGGDIFYVQITTSYKSAAIYDVFMYKYSGAPSEGGKDFHYGIDTDGSVAVNDPALGDLQEDITVYQGAGIFRIPICMFNNNKKLKKIILRENIHWQKINFKALQGGTGSLLHEILVDMGDTPTEYGDNPPVRFRGLIAGEGIEFETGPEYIRIKTVPKDDVEEDDGTIDPNMTNKYNNDTR